MIIAHVAAGSIWTLLSLAVATTRRAPRALVALQLLAAVAALLVGVTLWHALHAGPFGPTEHLLVVGTLCAFVALGLQLGVAPALLGSPESRLATGSLVLYRVSALLLVLAAAAMIGSLYAR